MGRLVNSGIGSLDGLIAYTYGEVSIGAARLAASLAGSPYAIPDWYH